MSKKVLIVDDSALMRKILTTIVEQDSRLEVVGTARNGEVALEKVEELKPDLITLDVEMPRMDGLTTLKAIMKKEAIPVVMISSMTTQGAKLTFECLDAGAIDFVTKPSGNNPEEVLEQAEIILDILVGAAGAKRRVSRIIRQKFTPTPKAKPVPQNIIAQSGAVAIGISTGGPVSIMEVIPRLPADLPVPVFMVQHMPPGFTASFAQRLDEESRIRVVEAQAGQDVEPGTVYLAPGGIHMTAVRSAISSKVKIRLSKTPTDTLHCPSVNVMMSSVVKIYGSDTLGVIMTGMGDDGTLGMGEIKAAGGQTLAEHESTCVIYGMPKSVVDKGLADRAVSLNRLADQIISRVTI